MDFTPPAATRSLATLETPGLQRILETEPSQTPLHRKAKGGGRLAMAAVRPDGDVSATMTAGYFPQTATDMSIQQPSNSIVNQLSDVLAATTLDESQVSTGKSRAQSGSQWRKQREKSFPRDAAPGERTIAKRARKLAKRNEKKFKKQQKRQGESMTGLPSSISKRARRRQRAHLKKRETYPRLSHSSRLSQIIQDDEALQEQDIKRQEDAEREGADTARLFNVQNSPDERLEQAVQTLQVRKALRLHRRVRKLPARERRVQKDTPKLDGDGITDTVME